MASNAKPPVLVASTGDTYCGSIAEYKFRQQNKLAPGGSESGLAEPTARTEDAEWNYFKSAQWSPDGTSLLTSSADNSIRTFIVPQDLLDSSPSPKILTPYTTHSHPTSINCIIHYPNFNLGDPTTTLYLSTPSSLPIRLLNALSPQPRPLSTYPLVSPTTEAYLSCSSLAFSSPTAFLAGTESLIALFDISRNGEGPVVRLPTIPSKRHKMKGGGVGMRGIISALAVQEHEENGMLAAGTWTRWVGLYDAQGMGGTVAQWCVAEAVTDTGIGGAGVSQTLWSACGRYLLVVERKSNGILVYDVRVAGKMVQWLEGRNAVTNQRLGVDVFEAGTGLEVWAGGADGVVRVWEGVGQSEGSMERSWEWVAHDDPATSTIVHSSGTVVATCSGQRAAPIFEDREASGESDSEDDAEEYSSEDDSNSSISSKQSFDSNSGTPDNSIKIWSF